MSDLKSNQPPDRTTELQSKLYQAAKRDPSRRFHALYDKLYLEYVLQAAWEQVRKNRGAAGIDQQTLDEIEALGVPEFLAEIAQALREKTSPKGHPTAARAAGLHPERGREIPADPTARNPVCA